MTSAENGPLAKQRVTTLIIDASRSHSDTPHSIGLLWTSDQPVAENSTWQQTTLTTNRHSQQTDTHNKQHSQQTDTHNKQTLTTNNTHNKQHSQQTTLTTHNTHNRHPCTRRDSNPQFQLASGHKSTP